VRTETVEVKVPVATPLPAELLQPCVPLGWYGTSVRDLVLWAEEMSLVLEACNKDKAAIRELQPDE
jgi:hypothetical protein